MPWGRHQTQALPQYGLTEINDGFPSCRGGGQMETESQPTWEVFSSWHLEATRWPRVGFCSMLRCKPSYNLLSHHVTYHILSAAMSRSPERFKTHALRFDTSGFWRARDCSSRGPHKNSNAFRVSNLAFILGLGLGPANTYIYIHILICR